MFNIYISNSDVDPFASELTVCSEQCYKFRFSETEIELIKDILIVGEVLKKKNNKKRDEYPICSFSKQ